MRRSCMQKQPAFSPNRRHVLDRENATSTLLFPSLLSSIRYLMPAGIRLFLSSTGARFFKPVTGHVCCMTPTVTDHSIFAKVPTVGLRCSSRLWRSQVAGPAAAAFPFHSRTFARSSVRIQKLVRACIRFWSGAAASEAGDILSVEAMSPSL